MAYLRARGYPRKDVSEMLGLSRSYVAELESDPDAKKRYKRQQRYRRPCPRCGTLMCGSEGNGPKAPRLCKECANEEAKESRIWTREAIIEAIQEFARKHGRPPIAPEWAESKERRGANYPPLSAVYRYRTGARGGSRNTSGRNNPFSSWAEAIEAAGFPRPKKGAKTRPYEQGGRMKKTEYVVLHEEEDGMWSMQTIDGARTPEVAIEMVAGRPGKYVAVRKAIFVEREVAPVTKYTVLASTPGKHD